MDFINKKIEEIKRQPEEIRMRWVWGLTIFSMLFVFLVWIILLKAEKGIKKEPVIPENQREVIEELSGQKKSIQETTEEMKDVIKKGITEQQK